MAYVQRTNIESVGFSIGELTFREMVDVANQLSDVFVAHGFDRTDPIAIATVLSGWSSQTIEQFELRSRKEAQP